VFLTFSNSNNKCFLIESSANKKQHIMCFICNKVQIMKTGLKHWVVYDDCTLLESHLSTISLQLNLVISTSYLIIILCAVQEDQVYVLFSFTYLQSIKISLFIIALYYFVLYFFLANNFFTICYFFPYNFIILFLPLFCFVSLVTWYSL